MTSLIKPSLILPLDVGKAQDAGVVWLSLFQEPTVARDIVAGVNVPLPGGWGPDTEGSSATFNGSQAVNLTFPFPTGAVIPDGLVLAARIKATATQPANPGAAFGIYSSTAQSGFGIGVDQSNNFGAAYLTTGGAGLLASSPGSQNVWTTVFVQGQGNSNLGLRAWINGAPAANSQGIFPSGAISSFNELVLGGQHRSSGFLRFFKGAIEWAAVLYVPCVAGAPAMTDALAAQLYAGDFPYNLLRTRKAWALKGAAAQGVTASMAVTQGASQAALTGGQSFSAVISAGQTSTAVSVAGALGYSTAVSVSQPTAVASATGALAFPASISAAQRSSTASVVGAQSFTGAVSGIQGASSVSASAVWATGIVGTISVSQSPPVVSASGAIAYSATVGTTQGAVTVAGTGQESIAAVLSASASAPSVSGTVAVSYSSSVAVTPPPSAVSIVGSVGQAAIVGTIAVVQAASLVTFSAAVSGKPFFAASVVLTAPAETRTLVIQAERHVFDGRNELMIIAPDGIAPGENIGFAIDYSGLLARSVLGAGAVIVASSWSPQLVYSDNIKVSDSISPSGLMTIIVLSGCTVSNKYHWVNTIKLSTGETYVRTLVVDGVSK